MLTRIIEHVEIGVLDEPTFRYRVVPSGASIGWRPIGRATCAVIRELAAERAATGTDSYERYLAEWKIPKPPARVLPGTRKRYYYILAKIAVGEGEYRNRFKYLWRGLRGHPSLLPRAAYLTFAACVREGLRLLGLLRRYEKRYLAR